MGEHEVDQLPDTDVRRVVRGAGERARRRRDERRARTWRLVRRWLLVLLLVGVAFVLGPVVWGQVGPLLTGDGDEATDDDPDVAATAPADPTVDTEPTVLVATFADNGESVTRLQLLHVDTETGRGAVVMVPTSMVADVPGYGLLPIGDAGAFGGMPLLELTVENQLGIAVDGTARLTEQDWAAVFARTGGFEVDVARPIIEEGTTERRFEAGPQFLDGPRLAELLVIEAADEDELTSFARVRQVLEGFLTTAAADGGLDDLFADGAPMLTTTEPDAVEEVLRGLAGDDVEERVVLRTLPVTVLGSGDELFYRLDDERAQQFIEDVLGGPAPAVADDEREGLRLEVLNGNGRAGVGADVAALLVPLGHTVAITRNAESFDSQTTRVLVYGDDDELLAAAQEIVDALGVGRIEISDVSSSVVDLTVLVGADFGR